MDLFIDMLTFDGFDLEEISTKFRTCKPGTQCFALTCLLMTALPASIHNSCIQMKAKGKIFIISYFL